MGMWEGIHGGGICSIEVSREAAFRAVGTEKAACVSVSMRAL